VEKLKFFTTSAEKLLTVVTSCAIVVRRGDNMNEQKIALSMAFSRDAWVTKYRKRFEGLLKEYTKLYLTQKLGLKSFWNKEVASLAKKVAELYDPRITARKGKWDLYNAAAEGFVEASGEQVKCKEALNDFSKYKAYSAEDISRIYTYYSEHVPDSYDLSLEILEKYLPKEHYEATLKAIHSKLNS